MANPLTFGSLFAGIGGFDLAFTRCGMRSLFASSPDLDKLLRALGDAMTGVVYADDRQVAWYRDCEKRYTLSSEGAIVRVFDLSQTP